MLKVSAFQRVSCILRNLSFSFVKTWWFSFVSRVSATDFYACFCSRALLKTSWFWSQNITQVEQFIFFFSFLVKSIHPDCSLDDGGSYFLPWAPPALLLRKYILLILLACRIEFMFPSWLYFFSRAENFEVDASHWWKRWRGTTFPLQDFSQLNIHKIQYRTLYPYISRVLYYMREAQDRK